MPKGPPVHEIFNPPASGKDAPFHYKKKESKVQSELTPKKTLAPLPPMRKFGGYKPKILGGNDDIVPVTHNKPRSPDPPVENRRRAPAPAPALTKPAPFIIGDKNTPMVLSTVPDNDSDSNSSEIHNGIEEIHIYEEPPMYMSRGDNEIEMNNNDLNNINNNMSANFGGMPNKYNRSEENSDHTNTHSHSSEAFNVTNENENLINKHQTEKDPSQFATENPVFNNTDITDPEDSRVENESEPEGVFIPLPDYDEDERTMDFDEEDPDEMVEEERQARIQRQQRLQQLQQQQNGTKMKVYDGEDLSRYLSDDEDEAHQQYVNNSKTMPTRLNQKHSLFKVNPNNAGKRKTFNKKQAPKFNSVRNFSYADSKYATSGKASGKKSTGAGKEDSGDYESFLSTSQPGEGYETFLTSKHGVGSGPSPNYNGKPSDGIWKKLTVRLKHKIQKNGYNMQEQF